MDPLIGELFTHVVAYEELSVPANTLSTRYVGCKSKEEADEKVLWLMFSDNVNPSTVKIWDLSLPIHY